MSKHSVIRGAAPVGYVTELDPMESAAVLYLRLWCAGPEMQQAVWEDLSGALGHDDGRETLLALEGLCALCVRHGRRKLMRHQPFCKCLGSDEACFANLVTHATDGEPEDALFIASLIVRPDVSPLLAAHARTFGLGLKRMPLRVATNETHIPSAKLH